MEGLADRSNKQDVLTTANISLSWWGCCSYNCNFLRLLFLLLPFLLLFLFSLSPLPSRKYKTKSDTRSMRFRWCLGRGVIWWAGAEWGRARLLCGRVGSLLLRNHQFSQFCVIKILALPYFQHTYLRTQHLIESLSQWLKIGYWKFLWTDGLTD